MANDTTYQDSLITIQQIRALSAPDFLLIMREDEAVFFDKLIRKYHPQAKIILCDEKQKLMACQKYLQPKTRIICFCTNIIIPDFIIDLVGGNAVNFHPGSPEYRGVCPASFALYEQKTNFGVTLHYIDQKIDHGDIIDVLEFTINPQAQNIYDVGFEAYRAALDLAIHYGAALSDNMTMMQKHDELKWSHGYYSKEKSKIMRRITKELSDDDIIKRCQYFERPYCPLDDDFIDQ